VKAAAPNMNVRDVVLQKVKDCNRLILEEGAAGSAHMHRWAWMGAAYLDLGMELGAMEWEETIEWQSQLNSSAAHFTPDSAKPTATGNEPISVFRDGVVASPSQYNW
jgi:hypothetical protein